MKRLHTALVNRMEKEAAQVQFFKELRVLNPRRLCDLSMSDNARRVAFMAHYNGDVEGRLD